MNQEKIGNFITKCRKEKKMTQQILADKIGVTDRAVSRWERGKGLPDLSLITPLCQALDITLNEFFSGEHLKEKEYVQKSEKTILNLLTFNKVKNKRQKVMIALFSIIILILLIILFRFILIKKGYYPDSSLKYSQVYLLENKEIKGNVDIVRFAKISIDFEIGANKYGYAVFKDPKKAMKRLKKDYKKGISLIKKEFNLLPLNNFTYKDYKTYGWQVTMGSEEEKAQARFISSFFDIYENSFN